MKLDLLPKSGAKLALAFIAVTGMALAQRTYEVTITNLTKSQVLTPALVAAHSSSVKLFEPGAAAPSQLEALSEEGNVQPYIDLLTSVNANATAGTGPIMPGKSETVSVEVRSFRDVISYGAMLLPTNDGFAAVRSVKLPRNSTTVYALAWDAGTEVNDELCESIPGPDFPECAGKERGGAPTGGEEGFVHIHQGITQAGDFSLSRNFNNPVAQITIKRVSKFKNKKVKKGKK